jgi:hypothetical protein
MCSEPLPPFISAHVHLLFSVMPQLNAAHAMPRPSPCPPFHWQHPTFLPPLYRTHPCNPARQLARCPLRAQDVHQRRRTSALTRTWRKAGHFATRCSRSLTQGCTTDAPPQLAARRPSRLPRSTPAPADPHPPATLPILPRGTPASCVPEVLLRLRPLLPPQTCAWQTCGGT